MELMVTPLLGNVLSGVGLELLDEEPLAIDFGLCLPIGRTAYAGSGVKVGSAWPDLEFVPRTLSHYSLNFS